MPILSLTHSDDTWVPDACRLPSAEQPLRVAELDQLLGSAVQRRELTSPQELLLELTPGPAMAARAADLAARESDCCGFFTFTLTITSERLTLSVGVPDQHTDVLAALATRYQRD